MLPAMFTCRSSPSRTLVVSSDARPSRRLPVTVTDVEGDPLWHKAPHCNKHKDGMHDLARGKDAKNFTSDAMLHHANEDVVA